jgi:hypothetical protein
MRRDADGWVADDVVDGRGLDVAEPQSVAAAVEEDRPADGICPATISE